MDDYISREAAYKTLTEYYHHSSGVQHTVLREALNRVPTADVRPVKHGEWIVDGNGDYQLIECDQCHAQMWNHQKELPNYCYECGADMRKVVEIDQVKEGET